MGGDERSNSRLWIAMAIFIGARFWHCLKAVREELRIVGQGECLAVSRLGRKPG